MPKPNVMVIGAQKAGSTSLYAWLGQHPEIFAPNYVKDLPFFTSELFQEGQNYYTRLFQKHQIEPVIAGCEINCLFFPQAAKRLYDFNPDLKLLAILRNPVDRALSAYKYAVQRGLEEKSFSTAIREELNNERNYHGYHQKAQKCYIAHGYYYQQLQQYLDHFDREQVFIGLFEELRQDVEQFMDRIYQFLDISQKVTIKYNPRNPTLGGYRYKWLANLLHSSARENPLITACFNLLPFVQRHQFRRWLYLKLAQFNKCPKDFPSPSSVLRQQLQEIYQEDKKQLEKLIQKDLNYYWF